MSAKRYQPTISPDEFDRCAPELEAKLRRSYQQSKSDADRPPPNPNTQGAFDHLPDLPSKTVASWSGTIKDYLGCKLDPRLIRRGGYDSFDDFWHDVSPKLRETCREASTTGNAPGELHDRP